MTFVSRSNRTVRTLRPVHALRSPVIPPVGGRGLTLADLIVVVCLFVLLSGSALTAGIFGSREKSNRIRCASNLKQIGLGALMYVNQDVRAGTYPRTYWDTTSTKLIVDTTGYGKKDSFDRKATGDNNVTASFFLILKTQELTPDVFVCPSTKAERGFGPKSKVGVQDSSNWEAIPGNLSYSYSCPFPTQDAVKEGWKFNGTLGGDYPVAADMNPGGEDLLKVGPDATPEQMKSVNSRNHRNEGQNVLYGDGHVDWQDTPFCGAPGYVVAKPLDNIYTYGGPNAKNGGDGIVGPPVHGNDSVLLPTEDGAKAEKPVTQPTGTPKG